MAWIDLVLNLAGVLLWLNWRAVGVARSMPPPGVSILSNLRSAGPRRTKRWPSLVGLVLLIVLRTPAYQHMGSALSWTAKLDLGVVTLPFSSEFSGRTLLFSVLSFGLALAMFYSWLLFFSILHHRRPDSDLWLTQIRLHLGVVERWPLALKLALIPCVAFAAWCALSPLAEAMSLIPAAPSFALRIQQGMVLGLASFLSWKYPILAVLAAYLLNTYVYFGTRPVWHFVQITATRILVPLRWMRLRTRRIDITPVVAIVLVWLIARYAVPGLLRVYQTLPF